MEKEFIITVFSENKVGLLSQITTVFTHRNVNIESLTASESAIEGVHKYTILVKNDEEKVANLVKQIEKKIDVLKVFCYSPSEVVLQQLALYKVQPQRGGFGTPTQCPYSGYPRRFHRSRKDRTQGGD